MSNYFQNFPTVSYNNVNIRNIILKTAFVQELLLNSSSFYEYQLKDGDRASTIAFDYYGSVSFAWLVDFSNNIIDPYYDWILSEAEFESFIVKKYGSREIAQSQVFEYAYYYNGQITEHRITPDTFEFVYKLNSGNLLQPPDIGQFQPIYSYEKELEINESKRRIKLIDKKYAGKIALELNKKMNYDR